MEIDQLYEIYCRNRQVSTDTRNITPGCLFFALKGENFNGNSFAAKALEAGASYAIIDEQKYQLSDKYILVPDALEALLCCISKLSELHKTH